MKASNFRKVKITNAFHSTSAYYLPDENGLMSPYTEGRLRRALCPYIVCPCTTSTGNDPLYLALLRGELTRKKPSP